MLPRMAFILILILLAGCKVTQVRVADQRSGISVTVNVK